VYDTWDLINGLGGLFGLFLGTSVLSVVEPLLFFLIKMLHGMGMHIQKT
jgi:Amiloride-sensitive sodium channel